MKNVEWFYPMIMVYINASIIFIRIYEFSTSYKYRKTDKLIFLANIIYYLCLLFIYINDLAKKWYLYILYTILWNYAEEYKIKYF